MLDRRVRGAWPWLVLAAVLGVAVWHVLVFSEAAETEFPRVVRPYFSRMPPAAYRLAEPGDTLDRVGLYFSSTALVLSLGGWIGRRSRGVCPKRGHSAFPATDLQTVESLESGKSRMSPFWATLWPSALVVSMAATWHSATPGPTYDGWHGLGWRVVLDSHSPTSLRLAVGFSAVFLAFVVAVNLWKNRAIAVDRRLVGLLVVAVVGVAARQAEIPAWSRLGTGPGSLSTSAC